MKALLPEGEAVRMADGDGVVGLPVGTAARHTHIQRLLKVSLGQEPTVKHTSGPAYM